jgi:hypothetical protein
MKKHLCLIALRMTNHNRDGVDSKRKIVVIIMWRESIGENLGTRSLQNTLKDGFDSSINLEFFCVKTWEKFLPSVANRN